MHYAEFDEDEVDYSLKNLSSNTLLLTEIRL
jgi:hypothetical protein